MKYFLPFLLFLASNLHAQIAQSFLDPTVFSRFSSSSNIDSNFYMVLSAVTPPALPPYIATVQGTVLTANDGTSNYLDGSVLTGGLPSIDTGVIPFGTSSNSMTLTFSVQYPNTSNPTASYCFPGFNTQTNGLEYEVVISRGTGETTGALWIQKGTIGVSGTPVVGSTTVGISGTTFTQNNKYLVTATATGTSTRAFTVTVQRVNDGNWLKSDGTWQSSFQTALSVSDSSSAIPSQGTTSVSYFNDVAPDARVYDFSFNNAPNQAIRPQNTPVITKGATYDGWQADALAAPAFTDDGTQYVLTASFWNIANSQWATGFFTSPYSAHMRTWNYVSGSLITPSGGDYIVGNSGFAWFGGKYWLAYNHYPAVFSTTPIELLNSTDLIHWTVVANPLVANGADPELVVNPGNSKLECWYVTGTAPNRVIHMQDSPDGTTWTDEGAFMTVPIFAPFDYGEPTVYYPSPTRYMDFDMSPQQAGYRYTGLATSAAQNTVWLSTGIVNSPVPANAWETGEVFDSCVKVTDAGDGYGLMPHGLYAGTITHSSTDNTASSIGLFILKP